MLFRSAAIGVLALTGVSLNVILSVAERRILFWHQTTRTVQ